MSKTKTKKSQAAKAKHNEPLLNAALALLEHLELRHQPPQTWQTPKGASCFEIEMELLLESGLYRVSIIGLEKDRHLLFHTASPLMVPQKRRGVIAEFITRDNCGLINGNLELDYLSGEVRFTTRFLCGDTEPSLAVLKTALYRSIFGMEACQAELESVVIGECTPEEAAASVSEEK